MRYRKLYQLAENNILSPQKRSFRLVAYLPDYRVPSLNYVLLDTITDLIFFSIEPTASGGIDHSRLTPSIKTKLAEIKNHTLLSLWVALGGWGRSEGFAAIATDPRKCHSFAEELTQFCLSHQFDGADFDWEHPADAVEEAGYTALLTETQRAFASYGLRLTATIAPWQNLDSQAVSVVDGVNLMTYDNDGQHSTFAQAQADTAKFLQQGVPPEKLCLGIPLYGRSVAHHDSAQSYAEIMRQFHPDPNSDEIAGFYFNGIQTVQQKTRYALDQHLRGIMVWEFGQDTTDATSLLRAIHEVVTDREENQ